jgi:TubC N-terminal docking domain
MNATCFLDDLRRRGITIAAAGDNLRVSPASALTAEDRELIRAHKADLLSLLGRPTPEDVAAALAWAEWLFWPAIVAEGGAEVPSGRAAWVAFSERCTAGDLAEVRAVGGWPEGLPPGGDGEPAQLAMMGVNP